MVLGAKEGGILARPTGNSIIRRNGTCFSPSSELDALSQSREDCKSGWLSVQPPLFGRQSLH